MTIITTIITTTTTTTISNSVAFRECFKKFCDDTKRTFTPEDASQRQLLRKYGIIKMKSADGVTGCFRRYPRRVDNEMYHDRKRAPLRRNNYYQGVDVAPVWGEINDHYSHEDVYEHSRPYSAKHVLQYRSGRPMEGLVDDGKDHDDDEPWSFDMFLTENKNAFDHSMHTGILARKRVSDHHAFKFAKRAYQDYFYVTLGLDKEDKEVVDDIMTEIGDVYPGLRQDDIPSM